MDIKKEIIVFILNDNNQVLLQKRSTNKKYHPNKWSVLSGHIEEFDVSFEDAAVREIKEELGIDILKDYLIKIGQKEKILNDNSIHITYFYYTKINKNKTEFIIQKEELSEVKWYDINTVIDMVTNKNEELLITDKMFEVLKEININF